MFCGQHLEIRITPAWAGKSTCRASMPTVSWDHPRVGGEKQIGGDNGLDKQGSPPRGRGKGCLESFLATTVRITPAWAGKSAGSHNQWGAARDHPRVGGEKRQHVQRVLIVLGSPPRGRGKDYTPLVDVRAIRITPAWAGKSFPLDSGLLLLRDHPRVGGEKVLEPKRPIRLLGSPPRGRGKVQCKDKTEGLLRITPAWAGKSLRKAYRGKLR